MRYCIFCGVEIPDDALYCQTCGKKQPEDTVAKTSDAEEKKTGLAGWLESPRNMLIAGVGGFLVVLAIATGVMILLLGN